MDVEVLPCSDRMDDKMMIKVSDFGLSHKLYESKDYYRLSSNEQHAKLPIKWMAIESISDSVFSEKSDVVSDRIPSQIHTQLRPSK